MPFAEGATAAAPVPPVESEGLEGHLDRIGADARTRGFCRTLARDGLAVLDFDKATPALCSQVAAELEPVFARTGAGRIQDAWRRYGSVRRLALHAEVRALLLAAYGRRPFAFQTLNFQRGTQQATHSDTIHFHSEPERFMCGVWFALEDIDAAAGPLAYYPGSHRLPVLDMRAAGVTGRPTPADYERAYLPALKRRLEDAGLSETTVTLRKGQAVVWAANLAHGGSPITEPQRTRKSQVTHYFFSDCAYLTPLNSDFSGGIDYRLPANVETGGVEWPRRSGRRIAIGWRRIVGAGIAAAGRRMHLE